MEFQRDTETTGILRFDRWDDIALRQRVVRAARLLVSEGTVLREPENEAAISYRLRLAQEVDFDVARQLLESAMMSSVPLYPEIPPIVRSSLL